MRRRKKTRLTITLFSNNEVKIGAEWPVIVIIFIGRLAALSLESTQFAELFRYIRLIISKLQGF